MKKLLFVIDMQEKFVGRGRDTEKFGFDCDGFIDQVNKKILEYKPDEVFYFKSIAKGGLGGMFGGNNLPKSGTHEAKFVENLKVVSENIFERSKPDVMSIDQVVDYVRARNIEQIELVGVDGSGSIGLSAITITNDYNVNIIYDQKCIRSLSDQKAEKMIEKFKKNRTTVIYN